VPLGEFSRGGLTRGEIQACDHDLGGQAQYSPCGLVAEATGQLSITFGSAAQPRDCIVEVWEARGQALPAHEPRAPAPLQLQMDNGPESSGRRPPVLHRLGQVADAMGQPIQFLSFPPSHRKYTPSERGWGI